MKILIKICLLLTLIFENNISQAQSIQFKEIEGAVLRKYQVLDAELKQAPLSTNFSDYFPQWGFTPRNIVYLSNIFFYKKSETELRICFNVSTTKLQLSSVEKLFSKNGYLLAGGENCTLSRPYSEGIQYISSYYKDIDISRIVVPSSLPLGLVSTQPLFSRKASLTISRNTTSAELEVSANLDQDTKSCNEGYSGQNAILQSFFNTLCEGLTSAEKDGKLITFGKQFKLNSVDNSTPLTTTACTLEFNNSCVLQFSLPNNFNTKRGRFYSQRLIWKEYVYARTPDTELNYFVAQRYGIIGINVK